MRSGRNVLTDHGGTPGSGMALDNLASIRRTKMALVFTLPAMAAELTSSPAALTQTPVFALRCAQSLA
jgi:hypothetical protein